MNLSKRHFFLYITVIMSAAFIRYGVRFLDKPADYAVNLIHVEPLLYLGLLCGWYYFYVKRIRGEERRLGILPVKSRSLWKIFLVGVLLGVFGFFMVRKGHARIMLPDFDVLLFFNIRYLFSLVILELVFRSWIWKFRKKTLSTTGIYLYSAFLYAFFMLASIGSDPVLILVGKIDIYLFLLGFMMTFVKGLFLMFLYHLSGSIYTGIIFVFLSTIPKNYEDGTVLFGDMWTALISLLGFIVFLIMCIIHQLRPLKQDISPI
jgi:hypothetical protein